MPEQNATLSGVTVTNVGIYTGRPTGAPARAGRRADRDHRHGGRLAFRFDRPGRTRQFGIEFCVDSATAGDNVTPRLVPALPQGIQP